MNKKEPDKIVLAGSKKGKKTYRFNNSHDETKPVKFWYQESTEGQVLFLVFYTLACRWSRCVGCNLPSMMSSTHVGYKSLMAQIDYIFELNEIKKRYKSLNKVIVSNNGSVFDQDTFSTTALIYLMAKFNLCLPNLKVVSFETRPEYVDIEELKILKRALREGNSPTDLEVAIGFEAFDENIRNKAFGKGLKLGQVEDLVRMLAPLGMHLKCYLMFKPISEMSDEEAIEDIKKSIDYLDSLADKYKAKINMHLNPTYVARGTILEKNFNEGKYTPPFLAHVAKAIKHAKDKSISVFLGLYDEGLAVEGGSFIRSGDHHIVKRLEEFNKIGDYKILDEID